MDGPAVAAVPPPTTTTDLEGWNMIRVRSALALPAAVATLLLLTAACGDTTEKRAASGALGGAAAGAVVGGPVGAVVGGAAGAAGGSTLNEGVDAKAKRQVP